MPLFLKVTAVVAVGIIVLIALAMLLKVIVIAALIAAVIVAGVAIRNLVRRRSGAITIVQRR